jgi:hypothetical protein
MPQLHDVPMPLWWAVQAGRARHQRDQWIREARACKNEGSSYDHSVKYAKMAHKEYRRLLQDAIRAFEANQQHWCNQIVDARSECMKQLTRKSGVTALQS